MAVLDPTTGLQMATSVRCYLTCIIFSSLSSYSTQLRQSTLKMWILLLCILS